jgi:hypothetical protein
VSTALGVDASYDPTWWVPVPLTVDPIIGSYVIEVWSLDRRYLAGKCLISKHPVRLLTEGAVLAVLRDYWPEFAWAWIGTLGGFHRLRAST